MIAMPPARKDWSSWRGAETVVGALAMVKKNSGSGGEMSWTRSEKVEERNLPPKPKTKVTFPVDYLFLGRQACVNVGITAYSINLNRVLGTRVLADSQTGHPRCVEDGHIPQCGIDDSGCCRSAIGGRAPDLSAIYRTQHQSGGRRGQQSSGAGCGDGSGGGQRRLHGATGALHGVGRHGASEEGHRQQLGDG